MKPRGSSIPSVWGIVAKLHSGTSGWITPWWADRLDELKEAPRRPLPRGGPPHWANGTEITPNSPLISATPSFVRPSETGSEGSGNIRIFSPLHWHAIIWTDGRLSPTRENRFIPAPQYRRVRPPRVSDRAFLSKFQQCDEQGGPIVIVFEFSRIELCPF
jgi:hypothetical protein